MDTQYHVYAVVGKLEEWGAKGRGGNMHCYEEMEYVEVAPLK